MTDGVDIRPSDPFGPEAVYLVGRLSAELASMYPEDAAAGAGDFHPRDAAGPGRAFLVAWLGSRPVGCAALRPMEPGVAEFKRLYVEPDARGRGIARLLLIALESKARDLGYTAVRVETGLRQVPSQRVIKSSGFEPIPNYGIYVGNPLSLCFEKPLI
jgi:GNAT superfamily N-acetyltransferase